MGWKMYASIVLVAVVAAVAIVLAYQFLGSNTNGQLDGESLYTINCSSCHEPLESSEKRGATAAQIRAAISNVSRMQSLSNLTSAEVEAIAAALSGS